jgi:hypothetical protein
LDLVLCRGDCVIRHFGAKGAGKLENWNKRIEGGTVDKISDFWKGVIAGFVLAAIIFGCVAAVWYNRNKNRELIEYAEKQIEIEALREDYSNRDPVEFLDNFPGVRGAADGAAAEFERKRDEALQRFRTGLADR